MKETEPADPEATVASDERRQRWPGTRRGRFIGWIVVFAAVMISQIFGLSRQRTGDIALLRLSVIVLAGVFLVATSLDYIGRSRQGL